MKVLLDTDVVLDFFLDRQPHSLHIHQVLIAAEQGDLEVYISPVALSNLYYLLRKIGGHAKTIRSLKSLMRTVRLAVMNHDTALEALHSDFRDIEDALQNFTAQHIDQITALLTRNLKDYKTSKLLVMTPHEFCAQKFGS